MGKKVLIVEPNTDYADPMKERLIREGFLVLAVEEGRKALHVLKREKVDFVLMEKNLPDMDGFVLLEELKKNINLPVIIVSEEKNSEVITEALTKGADDYMTKPFHFGELLARMRARGNMYERIISMQIPESKTIEIGDIFIDKASRRVLIAGEEKEFTAKEYELLLFFAEHPNQVFSKEELFQEIWQLQSFGDNATITVHIRKLRSKIEKDTSNPKYIETIWGAGYRFKV